MSDELKDLMRSAYKSYEAAGVHGTEGARAMKEGLARIEALEAALAKADALADSLEEQATHRISGKPHNPSMPRAFRALTAYREARKATT